MSPQISLLVAIGDDVRQFENSLTSLSLECQRHVTGEDYEIIVVEPPSQHVVGAERLLAFGRNVRWASTEQNTAESIVCFDEAFRLSRAPLIGFVGEPSIVTPRLVENALLARRLADRPIIAVPSYRPARSIATDAAIEARSSHESPIDAVSLFHRASFGEANPNGYLCSVTGSELFFCDRRSYEQVRVACTSSSTYDDVFVELTGRVECRLIVLAGEGCFRKRAGDANGLPRRSVWERYDRKPLLFGPIPPKAYAFFCASLEYASIHAALAREASREEWPLDRARESTRDRTATSSLNSERTPKLSVVMLVQGTPRQSENAIFSLSAAYQRNVREQDYEIVVVETRSNEMLGRGRVEKIASNVRYFEHGHGGLGPNVPWKLGITKARAALVGVLLDGASVATPGVVEHALWASRIGERALYAVPSHHLRPVTLPARGRKQEGDGANLALLESVDWRKWGYRLFEIAIENEWPTGSPSDPIVDCSFLFCQRALWDEIAERTANDGAEPFDELCRLEQTKLVVPWSEGTFHQYHAGIACRDERDRQALVGAFFRLYAMRLKRRREPATRELVFLGELSARVEDLVLKSPWLGISRTGPRITRT